MPQGLVGRLPLALGALPLLLGVVACADGDGGPAGDGLAPLIIATSQGARVGLRVEVASTDAERQRGLMGRESLPEGQGMLFVFPQGYQPGFWMKDTLIPLSAAFIAEDGTIVHIADMEPLSLEVHNTPRPYRYGLEVNRGWFARNGVRVGDRVSAQGGGPLPQPP